MSKSFLRTEIGERVEKSDFEHATSTTQRQMLQSIVTDLFTGDAVSGGGQPQNYVVEGFESAAGYGVTGTLITINGGKAIIGFRSTEAEFGMLMAGGADSRNLDINSRSDGSYGVYVRAAFNDDRFMNRLFWNAMTPTPAETPRAVATRQTEDWELAVELVSPGPEYMLVAQAVKTGASVTLTDQRRHLFEGSAPTSYAAVDAEWGGGDDRDADRALYGVKNVTRAVRGLMRQIQDIIGETGPTGWWRSIDRSLRQLVALDGSRRLTGVLEPDATATRDLGSTSRRFSTIFGTIIRATSQVVVDASMGDAISVGTGNIRTASGNITTDAGSFRADAGNAYTRNIDLIWSNIIGAYIQLRQTASLASRIYLNLGNSGGPAYESVIEQLSTGPARLDIYAGNGVFQGQSTMRLRGAKVHIGTACEGQSGIFERTGVTFTEIPGAISSGASKSYTVNITPPAGLTLTATNSYVIGWHETGFHKTWEQGLTVGAVRMSEAAPNQVQFVLLNTDSGARPSVDPTFFGFRVLIQAINP